MGEFLAVAPEHAGGDQHDHSRDELDDVCACVRDEAEARPAGGAQSTLLAAIDVRKGTPRDLRRPRSELEREMGWYDLSDAEFAKDRAPRLHCLEELQPLHHA